MKTITKQKDFNKITELLEEFGRIFIIGCGTCATMCHTGGQPEIKEMKQKLEEIGKLITGCLIVPTTCDELTKIVLEENKSSIDQSNAILVMSCGFGVQTVASYIDIPVIPALDTLFIGREVSPGNFKESCVQCGDCVLGETAGICPITSCHKGLLNGPCGGTNNGKCEIDKNKDCAWSLIYEKLEKQGRLDKMSEYLPPKDHNVSLKPGQCLV